MESGHGDVAILLIEAGADRNRVRHSMIHHGDRCTKEFAQTNEDGLEPEQMEGVGGPEQKRIKDYIVQRCGPP